MNPPEDIPPEVLKLAKALIASGFSIDDLPTTAAPPSNQRQEPYRVAEVAELLGVHRATIYRDIADGRCEAYRIGSGNGTIRIAVEDFEAYRTHIKARAKTSTRPRRIKAVAA